MVFARLLVLDELLQAGQGAERVDDDLAGVGVRAEEKLALGDVTGVVRDGVRDVAVVQGGHRDDGDGTLGRELHGLLVDLREVGVQGARHGVLGRDLVHTVGHDGQGVRVQGHVGQQHQDLLILVHGEVLGGGQGHVRHQEALHRGILGRVDEADDLVQGARGLEGVLEEEVVVVGQAHAAEDDLVHVGAEGHIGHHLVVGLVRVREERDLLAGHEGVVQVDAGDAGRDELGRLAALVRVHGRTADLALLALDLGTAVQRMAVGVEEAAGELVGDLEHGRLAEEGDFGVGRDAFGAGEDLQGHDVALDAHDLGELAGHDGQFVIGHALRAERNRRLGDAFQLGVDSLVCFHGLMQSFG